MWGQDVRGGRHNTSLGNAASSLECGRKAFCLRVARAWSRLPVAPPLSIFCLPPQPPPARPPLKLPTVPSSSPQWVEHRACRHPCACDAQPHLCVCVFLRSALLSWQMGSQPRAGPAETVRRALRARPALARCLARCCRPGGVRRIGVWSRAAIVLLTWPSCLDGAHPSHHARSHSSIASHAVR